MKTVCEVRRIWWWQTQRYRALGYTINVAEYEIFGFRFIDPHDLIRPRAARIHDWYNEPC